MIIKVRNLNKEFNQGPSKVSALKDVSFDLEEHSSLAIVGPSGSGKSTLLTLLAGLDQPTSGSIELASEKIEKMNERDLTQFRAENIGIVFQQFHLMPYLTALENVSLPLDINGEGESAEKASNLLAQVGLDARKNHMPHELSGGECQRVAIARASVGHPKILLADEPSGNLDTETGKKVMDLLFDLAKSNQMTLVLITHDTELAKRCDQQIHLVGGQIQ